MAADPRAVIDSAPLSRFQRSIVATMIGLNALDGFDVLSISFASPGIATEWGIAPERWIAAYDQARFKPELREKILRGNAARVLGLS